MSHSVLTIADKMLQVAKKAGEQLTPLQLMKLVYIANGMKLGLTGKPLFKDRIEAWQYGPVMPDLYHVTKRYGRDPIPLNMIEETKPKIEPEDARIIETVYEKYGHLSGYALSQLTHQSGTPWDLVFQDGIKNNEISEKSIKDHYSELIVEQRRNSATA